MSTSLQRVLEEVFDYQGWVFVKRWVATFDECESLVGEIYTRGYGDKSASANVFYHPSESDGCWIFFGFKNEETKIAYKIVADLGFTISGIHELMQMSFLGMTGKYHMCVGKTDPTTLKEMKKRIKENA